MSNILFSVNAKKRCKTHQTFVLITVKTLPEDNGERFFSEYITTVNPGAGRYNEADECLCHTCMSMEKPNFIINQLADSKSVSSNVKRPVKTDVAVALPPPSTTTTSTINAAGTTIDAFFFASKSNCNNSAGVSGVGADLLCLSGAILLHQIHALVATKGWAAPT